MSVKPVVAILGGTGLLVRVLSRDPASAKAQDLAKAGAVLYKFDEANLSSALGEAFAGVDVIVDTLSTGFIPEEISNAVIEAAARSPVKVYILSEWGLDHPRLDFGGYKLSFWAAKQKLAAHARTLMRGKKVIGVYTCPFLELVFRPGYHAADWWKVPSDVYECTGPSSQRVTFTSMGDIARTTARLAVLAVDPATAAQVSDEVRVAGTTASVEEIRDSVVRITGKPGVIQCNDLEEERKKIDAGAGENMFRL